MSTYDYVIVGAGSAGCVLAARLSEDPATRVLLLEAGPPDKRTEIQIPAAFGKLFHTEVDWDYRTAPEPELGGREVFWPRGKMLGGSSSINAMIYMRGHPADYDGWEKLGNEGWSWQDVLPYFKRSENNQRGADEYHGVGGPLDVSDLRYVNPVTRAVIQSGVETFGWPENRDFNGAAQEGIGLNQVTQRNGRRWSAASAFLKPALKRPNLTVITGALAHRVVLEDGRASGVELSTNGGPSRVERASREVILAAGAINSPQLLMLSGIGPAAHLKAHGVEVAVDLPGVGQDLQDHLAIGAQWTLTTPISLLNAGSKRSLVEFLLRGRGMLSSNVAEGNGFLRTDPSLPAPDLQLVFAAVIYDPEQEAAGIVPQHGFAAGAILLQPQSRGEIELASNKATDAPVIKARYLSDPERRDLAGLVAGFKICRRLGEGKPLDPYRKEEVMPGPQANTDAEIEGYIRERAATLYHPTSTCRMGSDRMAVVDDQLRVHGVAGLRVADASVMPRVPRGNTNAPTIMIGEKAADLIREPAGVRRSASISR
ncbi:MAG TPA: choline dehydrogenase [Candidatus Dormibacteraeota bacterium]